MIKSAMNKNIKGNLDNLQLSDIYSLMLFILYKTQDVPDYATLSELCFLVDGANMTRLLTYFEGKTVTFPSATELTVLTNALLLYQYINIEGKTLVQAQSQLNITRKQKEEATELYTRIIPIINKYNIDKRYLQKQ